MPMSEKKVSTKTNLGYEIPTTRWWWQLTPHRPRALWWRPEHLPLALLSFLCLGTTLGAPSVSHIPSGARGATTGRAPLVKTAIQCSGQALVHMPLTRHVFGDAASSSAGDPIPRIADTDISSNL